MKQFVLVILVAATALFGGLYLWQSARSLQREARIAELEALVKRKEAAAREQASAQKQARELRTRLSQTAAREARKASQAVQSGQERARAGVDSPARPAEQQPANAQTNADSGWGALFKTPEMREMVKAQQKMFIGPMLEQNYGALFRQLNLTDEQKGHLKGLLEKRTLLATESGLEILDRGLDPARREERMKQFKDETEAINTQIKAFLGDGNYPQFTHYEETLPERMQLHQYSQTLAGSDLQFSAEQEQQLLEAMAAERTNFNWVGTAAGQAQFKGNLAEMFSEESMSKFADQKAQLDQRVLVRAQQLLTPPQYASFERFINANRELQINAMKIGARMLAPSAKQVLTE